MAMNTRTALVGPESLRERAGVDRSRSVNMGMGTSAKRRESLPSTSTSTMDSDIMADARPRTRRTVSKSAYAAALVLAVAGVPWRVAAGLIQTQAVCQEQFGWMDNDLEQSPCLIAAFLLGACSSGNWDVPSIPDANHHYSTPNATTQNSCQCSWAVYNTMQACADCQGTNFESAMQTWASWIQGCSGSSLTNGSYYSESVIIPNETAIPFWATQDPTTWHDGIFDPSAAQTLANENKADITQANRNSGDSSSGSKSNTGAIAGGVVGGVIGIALLALLAFFFYRRRRQQRQANSSKVYSGTTAFGPPTHQRSEGDLRKIYDVSPGPTLPLSVESGYGFSGGGMSQNASALGLTQGSNTNTSAGAGNASHSHLYSPYAPSASLTSFPSPTPAPSFPPGVPLTLANGTPAPSIMTMPMNMPISVPMPPPGTTVTGNTTLGHTHTLSGQSTLSAGAYSMFSLGSDAPEGAISPFVLPPAVPEPMSGDTTTASGGNSGSNGGHGSKGGSRGSSADLFTVASPTRRVPERRNPPAYSASPEELTGNTGITSALGLGATDDGGEASFTTATASQGLTGTTAAGSDDVASDAGGSNVAVGGDGEPRSDGRQAERDRNGYLIDRKAPL